MVAVPACATLGPMPATTGLSAVPAGGGAVEIQEGLVPGFHLSNAATSSQHGEPIGQLSALVEPGRWLRVPGLVAGARRIGTSADALLEPYLGYRRRLSPALSVAGFAYGSDGGASDNRASYHATRGGAEAAIDARIDQPARWRAVHLQGAVTATAISARGHYCVDALGFAVDCDTSSTPSNTFVDGRARGVYPAATATLALERPRVPEGSLFDLRFGLLVAAGTMPSVRDGAQKYGTVWATFGMTLALAFGALD